MQRTQHERCKAHACTTGVRAVACMSGRKNKHAQRTPTHISAAAARKTRKMQDTTVHNTCMRSCALVRWPQHAERAPAHVSADAAHMTQTMQGATPHTRRTCGGAYLKGMRSTGAHARAHGRTPFPRRLLQVSWEEPTGMDVSAGHCSTARIL